MSIPKDYLGVLNAPFTKQEEEVLERSAEKNIPYGSGKWIDRTVAKYRIEQVLRLVGRPKKGG